MSKAKQSTTKKTLSNSPKQSPKTTSKNQNRSSIEPFKLLGVSVELWAILAITFFAFIPTFSNEFVNWDDDVNILKNNAVQSFNFNSIITIFTQNINGNYNPLPILTFAIERALFDAENHPLVAHTVNLLLHLGCVYFVYRIGEAMGLNRWAVILLTILFGIHPMRVESVAWATERKDVLFGIFYFAAMLQYIKYLKSDNYTFKNKYFIYTLLLFIIGLFAKVQMVSFPLSMLALDYYYNRPLKFNLILEKWLYFLGSLAMGLTNVMLLAKLKVIGSEEASFSMFERIFIASYAYAVYLGKLIFPWEMVPVYPYTNPLPPITYIGLPIFIVSAAFVYWAFRQGWNKLVFGWVFFFVNYIFLSQIVGAGAGYLADRFTYIPYFGFFFIIAAYTEGVLSKTWGKLVISAYLILCFSMTYTQTKIWKNSDTLWTHVLKYYNNITIAYGNRANYYRDIGESEKAFEDLNAAIKLKPTAGTHNSRGKSFFDKGKVQQALNDYNAAIKLDPKLAEAYANRAAAFGTLGKLDSAIADINKALELDPKNINALVNRGTAYMAQGKKDLALLDFDAVIAQDSNHQNAHLNRFIVYRDLGQNDKAMADNAKYLKINPKSWAMWLERAMLKRKMGLCKDAMPDYDEALKYDSKNGSTYLERARCHADLGNREAAKKDAQVAQSKGVQVELTLLQ